MELDYEIIEKYLNGDLSAKELEDFNVKLETDNLFKQEVALYKEINNSLKNKYQHKEKEENLKQSLDKMGTKYFQKEAQKKKSLPFKRYLLRISSIAAIIIISFFLLKPQTSLYDQFAEHANLEIQVKGDNDEILLNASKLYNSEKYSEAIPLLEEYLRLNPEDTEIQISLGIALLESNKNEDAIVIFEHVNSQNNIFKNKAIWYLALANIKLDHKEESKKYLESIPAESFYYKKAQKLLKKL